MSAPAIIVDGLFVRVGGYSALEDINFELPVGGFLSVIGPNGAGKTTLLQVILGLNRPTSGSLEVMGVRPEHAIGSRLGYVPQVKMLDRSFPARAIELVVSGLRHRWPGILKAAERSRGRETLESIGALDLADRPIGKLSGGELQRVYLARALIARPDMILLDEPATGIDLTGEADMYHLLEKYQEETGATVVMITHDLNAVCHLCSHVLVLNREQVGFGRPETALSEDNLRRAFGHIGHDHSMLLKVDFNV